MRHFHGQLPGAFAGWRQAALADEAAHVVGLDAGFQRERADPSRDIRHRPEERGVVDRPRLGQRAPDEGPRIGAPSGGDQRVGCRNVGEQHRLPRLHRRRAAGRIAERRRGAVAVVDRGEAITLQAAHLDRLVVGRRGPVGKGERAARGSQRVVEMPGAEFRQRAQLLGHRAPHRLALVVDRLEFRESRARRVEIAARDREPRFHQRRDDGDRAQVEAVRDVARLPELRLRLVEAVREQRVLAAHRRPVRGEPRRGRDREPVGLDLDLRRVAVTARGFEPEDQGRGAAQRLVRVRRLAQHRHRIAYRPLAVEIVDRRAAREAPAHPAPRDARRDRRGRGDARRRRRAGMPRSRRDGNRGSCRR